MHPIDSKVVTLTWSKVVQQEELLLVLTDTSVAVVNPRADGARSAVVHSRPCSAADWSPLKNSIAFTEEGGSISICNLSWDIIVANSLCQKAQTLDLLKDEGDAGSFFSPLCFFQCLSTSPSPVCRH